MRSIQARSLLDLLLNRGCEDLSYESVLDEWVSNARSHSVESTGEFIERRVKPIILREAPNPFVKGGPESGKPWAAEGARLYADIVHVLSGECPSAWDPTFNDIPTRAKKLVGRGSRDPLVRIFATQGGYYSFEMREALKPLAEIERDETVRRSDFLMMILAYYRDRSDSRWTPSEARLRRIRAWLRNGRFAADEEEALFHIASNLTDWGAPKVFDEVGNIFPWAACLSVAAETMDEGSASAGNGVASSISLKGWRDLREKSLSSMEFVEEAERIASNRAATVVQRLGTRTERRRFTAGELERDFRELTQRRLDHPKGLWRFVFYRLYPRWGRCRGYQDMLKFAEACWETGRHDAGLPYYYAEMQCRYVCDAELDPRDYFGSHPEIVDRCLLACEAQLTNRLCTARVRLHAPLVGSYIAFNAGRYDATNLLSRIEAGNCNFGGCEQVYPDDYDVLCLNALGGKRAKRCAQLQRLADAGRYRELLAECEKEKSWIYRAGESLPDEQFVGTMLAQARVWVGFAEGKDVRADAPPCYPGWRNLGWWRAGDGVWDTYPNRFRWDETLTWRAALPVAHELEFTLNAKPNTNGRHVLVVSRFQHEAAHHRPLNGLPYFTFVWEKGRTGLGVSGDYYRMFDVRQERLKWVDAKSDARKVRIACDGRTIAVFVGDDAESVLATDAFGDALCAAKKDGYTRFRGDNVRISNIIVRPYQVSGSDPSGVVRVVGLLDDTRHKGRGLSPCRAAISYQSMAESAIKQQSVRGLSPRFLKKIGHGAFHECKNLTSVTMLGERPETSADAFEECKRLSSIHVPANAKSWAGMKEWLGKPLVFDAKAN